MRKSGIILLALLICVMAACTTNNFSASLSGASDFSTVAVKDFISLGIVTTQSTEIHYSSPLGFVKSVEGSKITFSDLLYEAVKLEADDIINVRIDMNASYTKSAFDWLTGWTRTYTYTGTALAIKYTSSVETGAADPQLSGLPRIPEHTGAVRVNRYGRAELR